MIEEIRYHSLEEWEADYRQEVMEEAHALNAAFAWWAEPVMLHDQIGREDLLTGSSNLVGPLFQTPEGDPEYTLPAAIPVADEVLLRLYNLRNVETILRALSGKHEFTWEVIKPMGQIGERHLGFIEQGRPSAPFEQFLQEVASTYGVDLAQLDDHAAMRARIARHDPQQRSLARE